MRAKLNALREGRIPVDTEYITILTDTNITASRQSGTLEAEDEPDEGDEGEPDEVEGENVETEKDLNARVDHLMMNLMQQSEEHRSKSKFFVANSVWEYQPNPIGRPKAHFEEEYGDDIYGDDDE